MGKPTPTISTPTNEVAVSEKTSRVHLKRYFKPLMIYGLTIFSNAALSFATFALLTHYLTEVDYGIINLYNSFIILLMPFVGFGVTFVLNVDYFKIKGEAFHRRTANALFIPIVAFVILTCLLVLLNQFIQPIIKVNYFFIVVAAFVCLMNVFNDFVLNLLRNKERYLLFASVSLGKNIIEISFTILLVIGLGYTWSGRLGSNLIALTAIGGIILILIRKWRLRPNHIDKNTIKTIILAGAPFIPERLALFTIGYSDRFFIDYFSGTADVGYYGAGAQLAMVVNLSILTLTNTFYPKLFKGLANHRAESSEIRRVIFMYIGISAFITLMVIAAVPFFFQYFIGPNFQPGRIYAIYLTIGFFFWSIHAVFVAFLLNLRKNKLIMRISILGMCISIISNFISVRQFGALGATYTNMLVYFILATVTIFFVNRYYDLKKLLF